MQKNIMDNGKQARRNSYKQCNNVQARAAKNASFWGLSLSCRDFVSSEAGPFTASRLP